MMVGAGEGETVLGVSKDWNKPLDYSRVNIANADTPEALAAALRACGGSPHPYA